MVFDLESAHCSICASRNNRVFVKVCNTRHASWVHILYSDVPGGFDSVPDVDIAAVEATVRLRGPDRITTRGTVNLRVQRS